MHNFYLNSRQWKMKFLVDEGQKEGNLYEDRHVSLLSGSKESLREER